MFLFSLALWLFKKKGRDSSAEMLLLALSDLHSGFSVSVACFFFFFFVYLLIPYLESSIAPSSVHFLLQVVLGEGGNVVSLSFLWDP